MEKKKIQIWLPLIISLSMVAGIFVGYKLRDEIPGKNFFYLEKRRPVQEILDLITSRYVDDVDINALADTAIQAILAKLDPHSVFIPAKELQDVNDDIAGMFSGVGIEFNMISDSLHVLNVISKGPSEKADIKTGDILLKANGIILSGVHLGTDSIRGMLRGKKGSAVQIEILRRGNVLKKTVIRDVISVSSVDAAYMIDSITGFIRLNKFSQQTYREFMLSLEALKKQGMKNLIFDLRGNGGGVLDEAVEIADEFLDGDKLITYTIGKHVPKKEYRCRREGQFEKGGLVILADDGTASASEIILGALQDWGRANIVGRRSFGKGLVQDQYDLSDRSALRLTIARYYTPLGRSIQRPYANGGKAYYEEIVHRYEDGENYAEGTVTADSSKMYKTANGKYVFGGGGITPDYFIPLDTGKLGLSISKIIRKGLLNDYGYTYFLKHPSLMEEYKTAGEFVQKFTLSDISWNEFQALSKADTIDLGNIKLEEKVLLQRLIKSSIARQLWRNEGYFEMNNTDDSMVKKAMELLYKK